MRVPGYLSDRSRLSGEERVDIFRLRTLSPTCLLFACPWFSIEQIQGYEDLILDILKSDLLLQPLAHILKIGAY